MPYAEFSPQGAPGEASTSLFQGLDAGQSWMERSQAMKIAKQRESDAADLAAQNRDHYDLLRPVIVAQGQAQKAEAVNQLAGAVQMSDLTTLAQTQMPQLRSQWASTYQIQDPHDRLQAQEQVIGNADRFSSLKGTADEVKQWHDVWAQGQLSQRAKEQITGKTDVASMHVDAMTAMLQQKQAHDLEMAQTRADFAQQQKERDAKHADEMIKLRGDTKVNTDTSKLQNAGAYKETQGVISAGIAAKQQLDQIKPALALLDDPEVIQGTGADARLKLERLANTLGADIKGVSKTEEIQSILGQALLDKGKSFGSRITNRDLGFLENMTSQIGKSREGNKLILLNMQKFLQNRVEQAEMTQNLLSQGEPLQEVQRAVEDHQLHHSIADNPVTAPSGTTKPATSGFTADKEQRLQELRAKLGK